MTFSDDGLNDAADGIVGGVTHMSLHTANPGTTGANESTADRVAITYGAADEGVATQTGGARNFTGGASSGPCTHAGLWDAGTDGTFKGGSALTGDQTFNAAGEYSVTTSTITASNP